MPIAVSGFLSQDGNFFSSECEARVHDAEMEIHTYCTQNHIDSHKVMNIIEALADPILEYVNASQELRDEKDREVAVGREGQEDSDSALPPDANLYQSDDQGTGLDSLAVFEQSPDRPEPVSDLGGGPSPETIHNHGPRTRTRGRRRDA